MLAESMMKSNSLSVENEQQQNISVGVSSPVSKPANIPILNEYESDSSCSDEGVDQIILETKSPVYREDNNEIFQRQHKEIVNVTSPVHRQDIMLEPQFFDQQPCLGLYDSLKNAEDEDVRQMTPKQRSISP